MAFIDYFVDRATFNWEAELFNAIEDGEVLSPTGNGLNSTTLVTDNGTIVFTGTFDVDVFGVLQPGGTITGIKFVMDNTSTAVDMTALSVSSDDVALLLSAGTLINSEDARFITVFQSGTGTVITGPLTGTGVSMFGSSTQDLFDATSQ